VLNLSRWFRALLPHAHASARKSSRSPRVRLLFEELEDRRVPTVVFTPHYGAEGEWHGNGDHLSSIAVDLVFWGSNQYWDDTTVNQYYGAAGTMLASGYLSGITQYGSDAQASLFSSSVRDTSGLPDKVGQDDVEDEAGNLGDAGRLHTGLPTVYVFVTPDTTPQDFGTNTAGDNWNDGVTHLIWIGATVNGKLPNLDNFTLYLSHELAEAMSSTDGNGFEVEANPNWPNPNDIPTHGQIGDYEPNSYSFRALNGALVQPYWSAHDQAVIVGDGTSAEQIFLTPIYTSGGFSGKYNLAIFGDHAGGTNDMITLDSPASGPSRGGVLVNVNGEIVQFDYGMISSISVYLGNGNDTVNLEQLPTTTDLQKNPSAVSLTVYKDGDGAAVMNVSPVAQNLANIHGNVDVNDVTDVNLFDQAGGSGHTYTYTPAGFTRTDSSGQPDAGSFNLWNVPIVLLDAGRGGSNTINVTTEFHLLDHVGTLTVDGGGASDFTVDDGANSATTVYAVTPSSVTRAAANQRLVTINYSHLRTMRLDTGYGLAVVLNVPTNAFAVNPYGQDLNAGDTLSIDGGGKDSLIFDEKGNYDLITYTVTSAALTRSAASQSPLTINYAHLTSFILDTGWNAEIVNIDSTPAPTTVWAGDGTDTFNVGPNSHSLLGINGTLDLEGGSGRAKVTINDQANPGGFSAGVYSVTSTELTRTDTYLAYVHGHLVLTSSKVTVNYGDLGRLTFLASQRGNNNLVNVDSLPAWTDIYAGPSTSQLNIAPTTHDLDYIGSFLDFFGAGSTSVVINDQANLDGRQSGVATAYVLGDDFGRTATPSDGRAVVTTDMQFFGISSRTLNTSGAPNRVDIGASGTTTVNSGAADAITVEGDALIEGQVTVNAHGGTLHLIDDIANDDEDLVSSTFTVGYGITDQGISRGEHEHTIQIVDPSDMPPGYKGPWRIITNTKFASSINYSHVSGITLDGGAVDSSYTVWSTAAGTPVTINGNTGDRPWGNPHSSGPTVNQFQLGGGSVKNIRSLVTLQGSGTTDALLLDDSSPTTRDMVTVTASQIGMTSGDSFFGTGGGLTYSSLPLVTLKLSNARSDLVKLTPSAETAFTINGNAAQYKAHRGAELDIDVSGGVTDPTNTPGAPGAGRWTFGNRLVVAYTGTAVTRRVK
jgi:hypothetical protein